MRLTAGMGRDQHIGHGPKRAGFRQGFIHRHIQSGTGNAPGLQGFNQRRFIHHAPACDIHQMRGGLHGSKRGSANQPTRFIRQRAGQHDEIRARQKGGQVGEGMHLIRAIGAG